jgi:hypothetical protein
MHKARLMKERDAALTTGDEARCRSYKNLQRYLVEKVHRKLMKFGGKFYEK